MHLTILASFFLPRSETPTSYGVAVGSVVVHDSCLETWLSNILAVVLPYLVYANAVDARSSWSYDHLM